MSKKNLRETVLIITGHCEQTQDTVMKMGEISDFRWCKEMQQKPEHSLLDCEVCDRQRLLHSGSMDGEVIKDKANCKVNLRFLRGIGPS